MGSRLNTGMNVSAGARSAGNGGPNGAPGGIRTVHGSGGGVLILLGLIFLFQNMGIFILHNWWALFILIPAFGSYSSAYGIYQSNGRRFTYAVRGAVIGGVFFTLLAAAFLFGVSAGLFWPLVLILAGVALLVNFVTPQ